MLSARRMTSIVGKGEELTDVEMFYICYRKDEVSGVLTLFLVRADNHNQAIDAVNWDSPGGMVTCQGQYGIAEDKDGVVFACQKGS